MIQSPLKKKFHLTLNTSRGNRYSMQESSNGFSKSPFRGSTNQLIKCSQLEQELHRVNQQRKLLALELDEMSNQFIRKSKALSECEIENAILQQQLQAVRQQDDIQKLHSLLRQLFIKSRQKNQIILEWTNKFQSIEKRLESGNNVEQQLKQQQMQNDAMKLQLQEIKRQQKIMQENYRELKEERNQYYQQFVDTQVQTGSQEQKIKQIESEKQQLLNEIESLRQHSYQKQELSNSLQKVYVKKDKWKQRYRNLVNEREFEEVKSRKSSETLNNQQFIDEGYTNDKQEKEQPKIAEELTELKDKLQQLDLENQYLREQNIEMQTQIEGLTDKLLKQQLQSSMSRDQSQAFSFQQYHHDQCESIYEQDEQD